MCVAICNKYPSMHAQYLYVSSQDQPLKGFLFPLPTDVRFRCRFELARDFEICDDKQPDENLQTLLLSSPFTSFSFKDPTTTMPQTTPLRSAVYSQNKIFTCTHPTRDKQ